MSNIENNELSISDSQRPIGDFFDIASGVLRYEVEFNIDPRGKKLTFTLEDKDPSLRAVRRKDDDTVTLFVPPNEDRIFVIKLSNDWDWKFHNDIIRISSGDVSKYNAKFIPGTNRKEIEIHAKSNGLNPGNGQPGRDDKLDFIVLMDQKLGREVAISIDPITENPPPGGSRYTPSFGPSPIA